MAKDITFFAETNFRNQRTKFGIKRDDRRRHVYIIGKTGMGKTVLLENMAIQDIQNGHGVGFVDPHGEAAERLLDFVPTSRINDVIYFNPADLNYPISFNVMEKVEPEYRHLVASGLMGVFKKIWPDVWSARMEYILHNTILALLEIPNSTMLGINRMLADPEYRQKIVETLKDPVIKAFWVNEFARYAQSYEVEATAAIQNKIGQFISAPLIRNIIGQVKSAIDIRKAMDEEKILILNLAKGKIGENNSFLLGALLITKLQLAAMSRVDIPEKERKDFYLYVDEFQNFATEPFINILSEARKYRLALILAHQYISQLYFKAGESYNPKLRDAVFGNVGTIVTFRIGAEDAEFIEKEFSPEFTALDLVNLPKYNIYLKLMIDGMAGRPFSAETLFPFPPLKESSKEKIIRISQERYGVAREIIEEKISRWSGFLKTVPTTPTTPATTSAPPVLYDAQCSNCKKRTKVVFKPEPGRPTYCKTCRKKLKREQEKETVTPATPPREEKTSFISLRDLPARREVPSSIISHAPRTQKTPKKEVNLQELKKVLQNALDKK